MEKEEADVHIKIARLEERLIAANTALEIATENMSTRLASMNEFREQLKDQAGKFVTREALDLILDRLNKDKRADISLWISILAILIGFAGVVLKLR